MGAKRPQRTPSVVLPFGAVGNHQEDDKMTLNIGIHRVSDVTAVRVTLDGKLVGEAFVGPETKNIEFVLDPTDKKE